MGADIDFARSRSGNAVVAEDVVSTAPAPRTVETVDRVVVTRRSLRIWGFRSSFALLDQGFTSAAGFGVNLLLARWVPADIYGAFAVAFAIFLFISGFHNVLLLEPLTVMGPSRHAEGQLAYFRAQIVIHIILVGTLSSLTLLVGLVLWRIVPESPLAGAMAGCGLALPFMLLLWLARRMCYVLQRPSVATWGSVFYLAFVVAGLFVLGHFGRPGSFTVFVLMGCGSLVAAGLLLWQLGVTEGGIDAESVAIWRRILHENWNYSRWLLGSALLYTICNQLQLLLVAGILGLGMAGILKAMQLPSLVMTQVLAAAGLLVLPTFANNFGRGSLRKMRQKATIVSWGLFLAAGVFGGLLWIVQGPIQRMLFGEKYTAFAWLIPVLVLVPAANAVGVGYSMALRGAQKPQFDLFANLAAAPVAVVSAYVFVRAWGLAGAAFSMALCFLVTSAVTVFFFYARWDSEPALGQAMAVIRGDQTED